MPHYAKMECKTSFIAGFYFRISRMKYAEIGHNKCAECNTLYVPNLPPPISDSQQYEI